MIAHPGVMTVIRVVDQRSAQKYQYILNLRYQ
jgi:hypothetical protein